MIPDLSGDNLPSVPVDLDRDAVVFVRAAFTLPGQDFAPLGVLIADDGIADALGELYA